MPTKPVNYKSHYLGTRFDLVDYDLLSKDAKKDGMGVSSVVKKIVKNHYAKKK